MKKNGWLILGAVAAGYLLLSGRGSAAPAQGTSMTGGQSSPSLGSILGGTPGGQSSPSLGSILGGTPLGAVVGAALDAIPQVFRAEPTTEPLRAAYNPTTVGFDESGRIAMGSDIDPAMTQAMRRQNDLIQSGLRQGEAQIEKIRGLTLQENIALQPLLARIVNEATPVGGSTQFYTGGSKPQIKDTGSHQTVSAVLPESTLKQTISAFVPASALTQTVSALMPASAYGYATGITLAPKVNEAQARLLALAGG